MDKRIAEERIRCAVCGVDVVASRHVRHVRWSIRQGDPLAFARSALERSPYTEGAGRSVRDIPRPWWDTHADWIVERVTDRFVAEGDYVFGEVVALDELAREIWLHFDETRAAAKT
jgi:hypothetical protein